MVATAKLFNKASNHEDVGAVCLALSRLLVPESGIDKSVRSIFWREKIFPVEVLDKALGFAKSLNSERNSTEVTEVQNNAARLQEDDFLMDDDEEENHYNGASVSKTGEFGDDQEDDGKDESKAKAVTVKTLMSMIALWATPKDCEVESQRIKATVIEVRAKLSIPHTRRDFNGCAS